MNNQQINHNEKNCLVAALCLLICCFQFKGAVCTMKWHLVVMLKIATN